MARAGLVLLALALSSAALAEAREQTKTTPVQKVIELMNGMVAKGKKEKHEEQVQFAAYKQFCDSTSAAKQASIKAANEQIDMLAADIEDAKTEAEELTKEIAQHDEDISTWEGDVKASTKVREIENTGYMSTHKDYTESIAAIEDGIATLKAEAGDVSQKEEPALVQKKAAVKSVLGRLPASVIVPEKTQRAIQVFLAQDPDDAGDDENLALAAPEAHAFEFHSQGIVDMLTKLQAKFIDERTEMEKSEADARDAFEMLLLDLKSQIDKATGARTEKSEAKAKALQTAGMAQGDLEDTTATRDDDTKYLNDLSATCEQKASAFAERQTLRAEELEAIQKAIDIIASGAVAGASETHLPQLLQQKKKATSFAQLRAGAGSPVQIRVAAFLKDEATRIDSRVLSALATRVSDDPFKKVKKMIKDLMVKLLEEANEEAEHKGWCDTEMASNEQTRKEKTAAVETLSAEIDELSASIAKLAEDITALTQGVSDIMTAMAEATKNREEEKAKNAATVKDAQGAQTATAQAIAVLRDFYDKAAQATSLVQQGQEPPPIFEEPYKGMGESSGGVVGMMEVIQSDFARLETDTQSAETEGKKEYDEFVQDSTVDKTQKKSDIEHKRMEKQNQAAALEEKKGDLEGTEKELSTAMAYYDKLKPSCVDAGVSYEDRVARRKEEIESLQEALKILSSEG